MKILHINDQAGVACVLAKYQKYYGINSKVLLPNSILTNYKFDKFGIYKFYKDHVTISNGFNYLDHCISEARDVDVIHIHSMEDLVVKMRKTFGNSKKIILHYHGTDLRGLKPNFSTLQNIKTKTKLLAVNLRQRTRLVKMGYYKLLSTLRKESQNLADELLVSTPDLLELLPNAKYLPNPVDVDHFSKDKVRHDKTDSNALTIKTPTGNIEKTLQYCKHNNIDLKIDVFDRTTNPLQYKEVPNLLKKYDIYVDIRIVNDRILQSLSKTGLESLACGLKVLNYKLEFQNKLPEIHNPLNVVKQLQNIYNHVEFYRPNKTLESTINS
ncbi:MAG TPA: hypothetical protein VFV86_10315 [Nitrososphaeraceae archaeon]|nr:hypothetical protein [Nitrososphaeraceae archaeon]